MHVPMSLSVLGKQVGVSFFPCRPKKAMCVRGCVHKLYGLPMSVDKTDFGLALYNHANFYRFEETSTYWSVE